MRWSPPSMLWQCPAVESPDGLQQSQCIPLGYAPVPYRGIVLRSGVPLDKANPGKRRAVSWEQWLTAAEVSRTSVQTHPRRLAQIRVHRPRQSFGRMLGTQPRLLLYGLSLLVVT